MMRSLLLYVFFLAVLANKTIAQDIVFYSGLSTAKMGDMKSLQKMAASQWKVSPKYYGNFGPYWQHGLALTLPFREEARYGVHAFTTSTGSRTQYADFSGSVTEDFAVKCVGVMARMERFWVIGKKGAEFILYGDLGGIRSLVDYRVAFRIGDDQATDGEKLVSLNLATEVGTRFLIPIKGGFFAASQIGLQVNLAGELRTSDDRVLLLDADNEGGCDWTGLKASLGIVYRFEQRGSND